MTYSTWLIILSLAIVQSECMNQNLISDKNLSLLTEIKVGFLVGSRRSLTEPYYSRPGRHILQVFNQAIEGLNQKEASSSGTNKTRLLFKPVVGETFGIKSASIKQTIDLIIERQTHFLLGPQETCKLESQIASIYNVALLSHFCEQQIPVSQNPETISSAEPSTFIQIKPPTYKIVEHVVTLIGELLKSSNHQFYPQQLVLLYFKEPSLSRTQSCSNDQCKSAQQQTNTIKQALSEGSDPIGQYKVIGEFLGSRLTQLLGDVVSNGTNSSLYGEGSASLTVLNWHSTFHYGYTKNPFRQLVRQNLFKWRQRSAPQSDRYCSSQVAASYQERRRDHVQERQQIVTLDDARQHSAIYIIVGHYYEHLGLMLALDELNLLANKEEVDQPTDKGDSTSSWRNLAEPDEPGRASATVNQRRRRRGSVVIGVDTEHYDERDDSVRFLRGLLLDEEERSTKQEHLKHSVSNQKQEQYNRLFQQLPQNSPNLDSIASMYRRYLGVVPTRPTFTTVELFERLRPQHNQSSTMNSQLLEQAGQHNANLASPLNQTLDSLQLTARLLQFVRLPIEAYYLYDSIRLLYAYLNDCLRINGSSIDECARGNQTTAWFKNRQYQTIVNPERVATFDDRAQANGLFSLIGRRISDSSNSAELSSDDGFDLAPVAHFSGARQANGIKFSIGPEVLDEIWLPLWCQVNSHNHSSCLKITHTTQQQEKSAYMSFWDSITVQILSFLALLMLLVAFVIMIKRSSSMRILSHHGDKSRLNDGWYDERDEKNFLEIVKNYLLVGDRSHHIIQTLDNNQLQYVELHCHMFQFPSCKFVHWLCALSHLKELMFQYQSGQTPQNQQDSTMLRIDDKLSWNRHIGSLLQGKISLLTHVTQNSTTSFFRVKHSSSSTLKLLLNKYKMINESFIRLSSLRHDNVTKLVGIMLNYSIEQGKVASLVVEGSRRGNLRFAMQSLHDSIDLSNSEGRQFRCLLAKSCLKDILDGLEYLHKSPIQFHGELRATTCLVTFEWRLLLSGFHANHMRRSLGDYEQKLSPSGPEGDCHLEELIYQAPEVLENPTRSCALKNEGSKLADLYSFAFVVYELLVGKEPWSCVTQVTNSRLLLDRVKVDASFRPPVTLVNSKDSTQITDDVTETFRDTSVDYHLLTKVIRSCWSHSPNQRPSTIDILRAKISACMMTKSVNAEQEPTNDLVISERNDLHWNKFDVMSSYTDLLERMSSTNLEKFKVERSKWLNLQHILLPRAIVDRKCHGELNSYDSKVFNSTSFCSFKLTVIDELDQRKSIEALNDFLTQLDNLMASYYSHIHAFDSQVDSLLRWLVVAGGPLEENNAENRNLERNLKHQPVYNHSQLLASFALQLMDLINGNSGEKVWQIKCALHSGPIIGGVLKTLNSNNSLSRYVLLGNTLKTLESIESSCPNQRIQISAHFRSQLLAQEKNRLSLIAQPSRQEDSFNNQGYVMIKREGKPPTLAGIDTYWLLNGPRMSPSQSLMLCG